MKKKESYVRPAVQQLTAYVSARSQMQGAGYTWLDANENNRGPGFDVQINGVPLEAQRYPDPAARTIREMLVERYVPDLGIENVLLTNGGDEAIDQLIAVTCEPGKSSILISSPTFGMYAVSAAKYDVQCIDLPLRTDDWLLDVDGLLQAIENEKPSMLVLCNPNSPTGNVHSSEAIRRLIDAMQGVGVVLIDEAYIEYSDAQSCLYYLATYENVAVLRTFSKYRGLAGIRLGVLWSSREIIDAIDRYAMPYSINALTQAVAVQSLNSEEVLRLQKEELLVQRDRLRDVLEQDQRVRCVYPSETNFLWVACHDVQGLYDTLKSERIIIRTYSSYPDYMRVTVPRAVVVDRIAEVLA